MAKEQKRQGEKLEALEEVPRKNWDTLKFAILGAIGGSIGTSLIAAILRFM